MPFSLFLGTVQEPQTNIGLYCALDVVYGYTLVITTVQYVFFFLSHLPNTSEKLTWNLAVIFSFGTKLYDKTRWDLKWSHELEPAAHLLFHHLQCCCQDSSLSKGAQKEKQNKTKPGNKGFLAENIGDCVLLPVALNRHLVYIFCCTSEFY